MDLFITDLYCSVVLSFSWKRWIRNRLQCIYKLQVQNQQLQNIAIYTDYKMLQYFSDDQLTIMFLRRSLNAWSISCFFRSLKSMEECSENCLHIYIYILSISQLLLMFYNIVKVGQTGHTIFTNITISRSHIWVYSTIVLEVQEQFSAHVQFKCSMNNKRMHLPLSG